jgi:hypothetical protein
MDVRLGLFPLPVTRNWKVFIIELLGRYQDAEFMLILILENGYVLPLLMHYLLLDCYHYLNILSKEDIICYLGLHNVLYFNKAYKWKWC